MKIQKKKKKIQAVNNFRLNDVKNCVSSTRLPYLDTKHVNLHTTENRSILGTKIRLERVLANKSSNIGKTTTTNQCRRVPDLWRPGSIKIKRYYTNNGRLISTAKRGKEIKQQ